MSWSRIRGHEAQVHFFQQTVAHRRLAHAYLLTGPRGIGKRLFAFELAKALLCEGKSSTTLEACDRCSACIQFDAGTHADFFATGKPEDSLELPIKVVRELCQSFGLKSARGHGKVAVLDDADDLNEEAANCFLKTLEEPPPGAVLLLIGTSPDRQLSTIRSRCQLIRFAPLKRDMVAEILKEHEITDGALVKRLVEQSEGSPGQALALADPILWNFREQFLSDLLGAKTDRVQLSQTFVEFAEEAGKESTAQRQRASLVLRLMIEWFADQLRGNPQNGREESTRLQGQAARLDHESILALIDRCLEADVQIDRRAQLVLVIEALVDSIGRQVASISSGR